MADVFLSYRNLDDRRDIVRRLDAILHVYGVEVWWDYGLEAGEAFRSQILAELNSARIVVPLWCAESVQSPWVGMEAELGKDKLLPARLQNVEPPGAFQSIQSANLIGWNGDVRDPRLQEFVRRVCKRLGRPFEAPTALLQTLATLPPLKPLPEVRRKRPVAESAQPTSGGADIVRWLTAAAVAVLLAVAAYQVGAQSRPDPGQLGRLLQEATRKAETEAQRAAAATKEAQAAQAEVNRLSSEIEAITKARDDALKEADTQRRIAADNAEKLASAKEDAALKQAEESEKTRLGAIPPEIIEHIIEYANTFIQPRLKNPKSAVDETNMKKALELWEFAATRGDASAACSLGSWLGLRDLPANLRNPQKAAKFLLSAIEAGYCRDYMATELEKKCPRLHQDTLKAMQEAQKDNNRYNGKIDGSCVIGTWGQ